MKAYRRPAQLPPGLAAALSGTGWPVLHAAARGGYWRLAADGCSYYWVAGPPPGGTGSTAVVHYARGNGKSNMLGAGGGGSAGGGPSGATGGNGSSTGAAGGGGGGSVHFAGGGAVGGSGSVHASNAHVIGGGAGLVQWGPGGGINSGSVHAQYPKPKPKPEPRTAPGSVTGYRWWTLSIPDLRNSPAYAEEFWPHGLLYGAQDYWQPGVNHAACQGSGHPEHPPDEVPMKGCHCGFWAYWQWQEHHLGRDLSVNVPVFGVIEGWGRFRRGPHGFRVQHARILALHIKATLVPERECQCGGSPRALLQRGGIYTARPGRCTCPELTQAQAAAAAAQGEAWLAVMGDRLEQDYGVPVFATRDLLLSKFPADPVYGSPSGPLCPVCHERGGLTGHAPGCPRHL